jgi:hypothetical protein
MEIPRKRAERSDKSEATRIWVTVPIDTKEAIEKYAEDMNITTSRATQHFLKIGMTAEAIALAGGEVIARYPDGEQVPVANSHGNFLYRNALISGAHL